MTITVTSYPKTEQALKTAMKVAQRELPDEKLKVVVLGSLIDLVEKVGGDNGRESSS